MKTIKHIVLVALAALALGLASIEAAAPSIAGGLSGGVVAGSKPGIAGGQGATAGAKPGVAGGQNEMHTGASAPRITIDGGAPGGVVNN